MATKARTPKAAPAPAAAPAAAPAKVHVIATANGPVKAANHVATFKGTRPVAAGGVSYQLTTLPYNPAAGHVNALQWQATVQAIAANGGQATVAQVAQAFAAMGLAPGLATGFLAYRTKGNKPNLAIVG